MDITFIASECALIAKAGGLGDVVHGLSKQLAEHGHNIRLIMPLYSKLIPKTILKKLKKNSSHSLYYGKKKLLFSSYTFNLCKVKVIFLSPDIDPFFSLPQIYGYKNDDVRFAIFSLMTFIFLKDTHDHCNLLHIHDWPTGLLAYLIKTAKLFHSPPKILLTIHHFKYQGLTTGKVLNKINASLNIRKRPIKDSKTINCMHEGILYADYVNTVSPSYAQEISQQKNKFSSSLIFKENFYGILNGIDQHIWNPKTDPFIKDHYSINDLHTAYPFISQKEKNKRLLRSKLKLNQKYNFLVGLVLRLAPEKGLEFIKTALIKILEKNAQCVLLGSCTDKETLSSFQNLSKHFASSDQIRILLTYDEQLAHLIYAGSDLFLMPSIEEPCGLAQMIAMNYGTVPLVRKTGGLNDTVQHMQNGFVFASDDLQTFHKTFDEIVYFYRNKPSIWYRLMKNGLKAPWGWKSSTQEYEKIYKKLLRKPKNQ